MNALHCVKTQGNRKVLNLPHQYANDQSSCLIDECINRKYLISGFLWATGADGIRFDIIAVSSAGYTWKQTTVRIAQSFLNTNITIGYAYILRLAKTQSCTYAQQKFSRYRAHWSLFWLIQFYLQAITYILLIYWEQFTGSSQSPVKGSRPLSSLTQISILC